MTLQETQKLIQRLYEVYDRYSEASESLIGFVHREVTYNKSVDEAKKVLDRIIYQHDRLPRGTNIVKLLKDNFKYYVPADKSDNSNWTWIVNDRERAIALIDAFATQLSLEDYDYYRKNGKYAPYREYPLYHPYDYEKAIEILIKEIKLRGDDWPSIRFERKTIFKTK